MNEFDGIDTFEGWSKKLYQLLEEAENFAQQDEFKPRLDIAKRLNNFVIASSPNTTEIRALDEIAHASSVNLMRTTISERLESLKSREADLVRLTKNINAQTENIQASAKSIRLEKANKIISNLTESVKELKAFKDMLPDAGEQQLAERIQRLISSTKKVRDEIESIT